MTTAIDWFQVQRMIDEAKNAGFDVCERGGVQIILTPKPAIFPSLKGAEYKFSTVQEVRVWLEGLSLIHI